MVEVKWHGHVLLNQLEADSMLKQMRGIAMSERMRRNTSVAPVELIKHSLMTPWTELSLIGLWAVEANLWLRPSVGKDPEWITMSGPVLPHEQKR